LGDAEEVVQLLDERRERLDVLVRHPPLRWVRFEPPDQPVGIVDTEANALRGLAHQRPRPVRIRLAGGGHDAAPSVDRAVPLVSDDERADVADAALEPVGALEQRLQALDERAGDRHPARCFRAGRYVNSPSSNPIASVSYSRLARTSPRTRRRTSPASYVRPPSRSSRSQARRAPRCS